MCLLTDTDIHWASLDIIIIMIIAGCDQTPNIPFNVFSNSQLIQDRVI